jgi:hypothetical protein
VKIYGSSSSVVKNIKLYYQNNHLANILSTDNMTSALEFLKVLCFSRNILLSLVYKNCFRVPKLSLVPTYEVYLINYDSWSNNRKKLVTYFFLAKHTENLFFILIPNHVVFTGIPFRGDVFLSPRQQPPLLLSFHNKFSLM